MAIDKRWTAAHDAETGPEAVDRACGGEGAYDGIGDVMQNDRAYSDAHCHVAFMADPDTFAHDAHQAHASVFAVTTTPSEYRRLMQCETASHHLAIGLGLHPWWVPADEAELHELLSEFDGLFDGARFIGEVGLDYSMRCVETKAHQLRAFSHIVNSCVRGALGEEPSKRRVLSMHCVHAYDDMLSLLDQSGCAVKCDCIFHWFSGSSDHLQRAIRLGCYFSVSERMLSSKRGREYAKAIPSDRLLLETDAPFVADPLSEDPVVPCVYGEVAEELRRTATQLAGLRNESLSDLSAALAQNASFLDECCR